MWAPLHGAGRCLAWLGALHLESRNGSQSSRGTLWFEMRLEVVTVHKGSLEASSRGKRGDPEEAAEKTEVSRGTRRRRIPHELYRLVYHGPVPVPWRVLDSTPRGVNVSKVLKKQMFLYNQGF